MYVYVIYIYYSIYIIFIIHLFSQTSHTSILPRFSTLFLPPLPPSLLSTPGICGIKEFREVSARQPPHTIAWPIRQSQTGPRYPCHDTRATTVAMATAQPHRSSQTPKRRLDGETDLRRLPAIVERPLGRERAWGQAPHSFSTATPLARPLRGQRAPAGDRQPPTGSPMV